MSDRTDIDSLPRRLEELQGELASLRSEASVVESPDEDLRRQFEGVAGKLQALLAATNGGHGTIDTRSGETIAPLDPDPEAIELDDVAHALSNLGRFAGQGREFYSVARHAVHVSREVEARGGGRVAQQWGLLHDASEAYLADVPAPVKRSLPGYTVAEKRLQATIRDAFGIELTNEAERAVDRADGAVGRYELAVQFPDADRERPGLASGYDELPPDEADDGLFRDRAERLGLE